VGTQLEHLVKQAAFDAGFELAGIAATGDFPELARFPEWVSAGRAGEMKYLESRDDKGQLRRASLRSAFPWARSVIVCAINYNTAQPYSTAVNNPGRGWISRYAWGREDYHDSVLRRVREVEAKLQGIYPDEGPVETRSYVDAGPLVERVYARYAGVGWGGQNTYVLNRELGSQLFLALIVTSI